MFGRKSPAAVANPMSITHTTVLDGTCGSCSTAVSVNHTHTARLGETGTATGTATHHCGTQVTVSGQF